MATEINDDLAAAKERSRARSTRRKWTRCTEKRRSRKKATSGRWETAGRIRPRCDTDDAPTGRLSLPFCRSSRTTAVATASLPRGPSHLHPPRRRRRQSLWSRRRPRLRCRRCWLQQEKRRGRRRDRLSTSVGDLFPESSISSPSWSLLRRLRSASPRGLKESVSLL